MRRFTMITIATLGIAALLVAGLAFSNGPKGGTRKIGDIPLDNLSDELELTESQIDEIKQIRYKHNEDEIDRRAELEKARLEMRKFMDEEDFDKDEIYKRAAEIAELEMNLKLAGIEAKLDGMNVLTEEQREALVELREERMLDRRERHMDRRSRMSKPQSDHKTR